MTNVGTVVHVDTVVGLEPPDELPVADIDRNNLGGPASKQNVGESSGRRARVEATLVGDGQTLRLESFESTEQLVRTARRPVVAGAVVGNEDGGVARHICRGLRGKHPIDGDLPRLDQLTSLLSRAGQLAADELGVEPCTRSHSVNPEQCDHPRQAGRHRGSTSANAEVSTS
ncbi:Uncharacterised protein [Mycobacteroides abscessus subsp. abscessus]|nr:Uncharacterised protein [Mycobacteroides abscessus subsp. abscessus]